MGPTAHARPLRAASRRVEASVQGSGQPPQGRSPALRQKGHCLAQLASGIIWAACGQSWPRPGGSRVEAPGDFVGQRGSISREGAPTVPPKENQSFTRAPAPLP